MIPITAHPRNELLAAFASGSMPLAPSLAVSAHLGACPVCRVNVGRLETAGGAILSSLKPTALGEETFARTADEIARPVEAAHSPTADDEPALGLPRAVLALGLGWKRPFGRNAWIAPVRGTREGGWSACIIHAPARARLAEHGHSGPEFTYVVNGAYFDGPRRYGPGDFAEAEAEPARHRQIISDDGPCTALMVCEGRLKYSGLLRIAGLLLRP